MSSEEEEADGAGGSIRTAANLTHSWQGSCATMTGASTFTLTSSASSRTNSTKEASASAPLALWATVAPAAEERPPLGVIGEEDGRMTGGAVPNNGSRAE